MEWVCEWCERNKLVTELPEICRVKECPIHGRVWHWPRGTTVEERAELVKEC